MVKGGYTPLFCGQTGGIDKVRPREAPLSAPNCPKFSSDALASCAQPLPSTHTFFSGTFLGLTGPRRTRGLRYPPCWPYVGGVCPHKSTKLIYYPRVTIISPHLTDLIPLLYDHLYYVKYGSPKSRYKHIFTSTARTARKGRTTGRKLLVLAIDFFGKYTKNQIVFQIKDFIIIYTKTYKYILAK